MPGSGGASGKAEGTGSQKLRRPPRPEALLPGAPLPRVPPPVQRGAPRCITLSCTLNTASRIMLSCSLSRFKNLAA